MVGIARGLAYLHSVGVIHSNLKAVRSFLPRSLLSLKFSQDAVLVSSSNEPQIANYTSSRMESDEEDDMSDSLAGMDRWMAPELLTFDEEDSSTPRHTNKVDIWSFGMTVYVRNSCPKHLRVLTYNSRNF